MTTLSATSTLTTLTRGTMLGHLRTTTALAPPVRVSAGELTGSVVLLAPGRRLLVSDDTGARWRAVVNDRSVASVHTPAHGADTAVVLAVDAVAIGRTRGHLLDACGRRHPFEVIVMDLQRRAQTSDQPAHRAVRSTHRSPGTSWGARLRRALLPAGWAHTTPTADG